MSVVTQEKNMAYRYLLKMKYFLALFKWLSFDVDKALRIKLFCPIHWKSFQDLNMCDIWPWMYGMDRETIEQLESGEIKRQEVIQIELNKYFEKLGVMPKLTLKKREGWR